MRELLDVVDRGSVLRNFRLLTAAIVAVGLMFGVCSVAFGASSSGLPKHLEVPAPKKSHSLSDAITFDEVPLATTVTDQYLHRGVLFGNPNQVVFTTEDGSNPTEPSLSGTPRFHGPIVFSFVQPGTRTPRAVRGFDLDVGYINNRNSVQIRYYDGSGAILGAERAQSLGMNAISVRRNGIVTVEVEATSQEDAGFGIDNLAFETEAEGAVVQRMAMMGDSFTSGEGLSPNRSDVYDCGTDVAGNFYYEGTTAPTFRPWLTGTHCMPGLKYAAAPDAHDPRIDLRPLGLQRRTFVTYENLCHRASVAWPNLIRRSLGVSGDNAMFVACSGAKSVHFGAKRPGESNYALNDTEAQYVNSPPGVFGARPQADDMREFVGTNGQFDLITVSIGGNDALFGPVITDCLINSCLLGTKLPEAMKTVESVVYGRLRTTFTALRGEFAPATVAVFGYPDAIDPEVCGGAFTRFGIDNAEQEFLAKIYLPAINTTIREAAEASGVTYIDLSTVARGHELCRGDQSWFNGPIRGDDTLGLVGNESYHPNQDYHKAVHDHFMANYVANGRLVFSNPEPRVPIRSEHLGTRVQLGSVHAAAQSTCGTNCIRVRVCNPGECSVQIRGSDLSPNTSLRVRGIPLAGGGGVQHAHSQNAKRSHQAAPAGAFDLGTVTTDANGNFAADIAMPAGLPAGNYAAEIEGTDPALPIQFGNALFRVNDITTEPKLASGEVRAKVQRWSRDGLRVKLTCPKALSKRPCVTALSLHRTANAKRKLASANKTTVKVGRSKVVTLRARSLTAANKRLAKARAQLRTAKRIKARTPAARRAKVRAIKRATARTRGVIKARQRVIKTNRTVVAKLKVRRGVVRVIDSEVRSTIVAKPVKVKKAKPKAKAGKGRAPKAAKKR